MSGPPVENWDLLTGPAGWFRIWHPPQWRVVQNEDGSQSLSPQDERGFFVLRPLWTRTPEQVNASPAIAPGGQSQNRNVRLVEESGVPHCLYSRTGEASVNRPETRWQRLLHRPAWRTWQMWVLQQGPIVLIATLVHGDVVDPELTTLCRMVLQSIEFVQSPADPPEVFAERVLALAQRRFPLLECRPADGLQIRVGASMLNLVNFYRLYVRAPDRFEDIVLPALTTVVQVQEWGDAQTRPPLERVRDRIMPMLYPESVWQDRFARFVGTPWVAGLAVLYVVDEPHAYWYISQELLSQWRLSLDELHSLSLENLERYFEKHPMELAVAGAENGAAALLMPDTSDSYNASRLVSTAFTAQLRNAAGGNLAIGLPGRDLFVAVNLKFPDMLAHVRNRVREDFASMDHPLTDRLLLLTADGMCEFCNPETP